MKNEKNISRRTLLEAAAAMGVVTVIGSNLHIEDAFAQGENTTGSVPETAQYGFLFKVKNCVDCGKCVDACKKWSRTSEGTEARRKVASHKNDVGREYYVSSSCMHCANPSCVTVCPAGALSKAEGGIVIVDEDRCIGCKYCYQACPFSVPHYNATGMDKCDYCLGNDVPLGETPKCVQACIFGALQYGCVDEFISRTNGRAEQIEAPTDPSFYLY